MTLLRKIHRLFGKEKLDAEMAEEMRLHLEMQTERNVAAGMNADEARHAARRKFGGIEQIKERCRDQRSWTGLEQLAADMRFSLRSLNRARGYTLAMIVTLSLGIGAAILIFNVTAGILFQKASYPNPSELVAIGWKDKWSPFQLDLFRVQLMAYQEQTDVFANFAAIEGRIANVVVDGEPAPANHVAISPDGFHTLGIMPAMGRGFLPEEYNEGADRVVVVTDDFWRTRLNADPSIIGREILIDQRWCKVVGVLRSGQLIPFRFQGDVYRPLMVDRDSRNRFGMGIHVVGRLRKGVSLEEATAALSTVRYAYLSTSNATFLSGRLPVVLPIDEVGDTAVWWVLFTAGVFLFGMACLNAMNLMLVRLLGRSREFGIRLAVGCSRARLARLLIFESAGLTLAAGLIVLLLAHAWFQPLFVLLYRNASARFDAFGDWVTVGGIAVLCIVATVAIACVPILRLAKRSVSDDLKAGGTTASESRNVGSIRNYLVMLQTALAVILLVGTGLMMRTVQKLQTVDLGFDPAGKMKVWLIFPTGMGPKLEMKLQYMERLRQRVALIPGVIGAAVGGDSLLVGNFWAGNKLQMSNGEFDQVGSSFLSADYGNTGGMRLKRGRWFSGRPGEREVVLNESLARARFGAEDPIGQFVQFHDTEKKNQFQVVGVVHDVKETLRAAPGRRIYLPDWVSPASTGALVLRLRREPESAFKSEVRRAIYDFDPNVITNYVAPLQEVVESSIASEKFVSFVLRGVATIALALAILGVFSVMAFSVKSRTKEFGVRLALGAVPANLHRLVLKRGLITVGTGVLVGGAMAMVLTQFMRSLLFETAPNDPLIFIGAAGVLLASAVAACWLPARSAAKVDPMVALRCE